MIEVIKTKCSQLEKQYDFKILFAVESGSRLWGMDSKDSDYDVHCVFYYPVDRYLSLNKPTDNFTWMSGNKILDINGFDIYKYAILLLKSNPNMIDWTMSNIVYYGNKGKITSFVDFAKNEFNPFTLYQFYYGISHSAWGLIKKGNRHYKKYLYVLRGLLNAQWLIEKKTLPPYNFEHVVKELPISNDLRKTIMDLLIAKRNATEKSEIQSEIDFLIPYIEERFSKKEDDIGKLENRKPTKEHYKLFTQVILDIIGF